MKKLISLVIVSLLILSVVPLSVFAETDGLVFELSQDGTYYIVDDYTGTDTEVVIPSSYNGLPVKEIGYDVFNYNKDIKSVVIPDSVTAIQAHAFQDCTALENVTMSKELVYLGIGAFRRCENLTELVLPDTLTAVDRLAVSGCTSLNYSSYDNGLYLGNENNPYLVLATVVSKDITSCIIHEDARIIAGNAFDSSNLESIEIPETVIFVGSGAFNRCSMLADVTLPNTITSLETGLFNSCTSLETVIIPDSVTAIRDSVFWQCTSLKGITISDSVTSIGMTAFISCEAFTSVYIPASVEYMEHSVFTNCDNLTDIYCAAPSKPENWDDFWMGDIYPDIHWGTAASGDVIGDVTGDGKLDMYDYLMVKSHYFGRVTLDSEQLLRADVNPDGNVDMYDYLAIKSIYFAN